jgi:hypothetical protein
LDDFLGIECRDLIFKGHGLLIHGDKKEPFSFEGPIHTLRAVF